MPAAECDRAQVDREPMLEVEQAERDLAARTPGVASVSLDSLICPDQWCRASVGGIPTHRDNHHMTDGYASELVPRLDALLAKRGVDLAEPRD